jgi:hypothetical protein
MINGIVVSETLNLVCVLIVLFCVLAGVYLVQRYTGV